MVGDGNTCQCNMNRKSRSPSPFSTPRSRQIYRDDDISGFDKSTSLSGKLYEIINTIILCHYFPNYIGYRLKHGFVTRLQFNVQGGSWQASRAIWLNCSKLVHQQGNLDPVHVGLISYICQTSEPLSEVELFDTLFQQCETVCRRQSQILHFLSKHLSLG